MGHEPAVVADGPVSRRRYLRERQAREEAERLLDQKSRDLFEANDALKRQAASLEDTVIARTAALAEAKAEAERASDAKTAFLAMISHEIRTPLNGLLGMAEALQDSGLDTAQQSMLDVMTESGQSLLSIVNDILDLTKIEAEQLEIEKIEFDPSELLDGVFRLYSIRAEEKGLEFGCALGASVRCRVVSDPTRVRQVVSNLVSNAVKFTATGHVNLSARVEPADAGNSARLIVEVSDSGPGVPLEKRDRLFKPFSQTDPSVTRRHGGTGLGLWIARKMCLLMGGDLSFSGPATGGAVFTASFAIDVNANSAEKTCEKNLDAVAILHARPWQVLVAEDNKTNQLVLHHLLKRYPMVLTMVENGAQALAAIRENPFDIVLMDVNMPVMGGLEAAAAIRDIELEAGQRHCPVIALTANAMTHQVEDYLRRGIDGHVAKPVRREVLVQRMADLLTKSQNAE